jgi:hypothetical protein
MHNIWASSLLKQMLLLTPDDWTIVVGDLIPLGSNSSEGGTLRLGWLPTSWGSQRTTPFGRQTVILDRAETWNDAFGASDSAKPSLFVVAMREIGNLLGLGPDVRTTPWNHHGR